MKAGTKNFFRGTAIMIGTIVGVGIFGVPYVVSQTGLLIGVAYLIILGAILLLSHLLYGEAMLRTGPREHLAALTRTYLGSKWGYAAAVITMLGFYGGLIAYIIIGGEFLHILLAPFFDIANGLFIYQVLFFSFMAFFVLVGLRLVAFVEVFMTIFLLLAVFVISFAGVPKIEVANFWKLDFAKSFLPYGVIFFSLSGAAAIPEVVEVMSRSKRKIKHAIVWGSVVPIVITLFFAVVVVGINGTSTSMDAIDGLGGAVGNWVVYLGAVFGLFAVATSFLIMALYLKEQFWYDFKLNEQFAWFLACFVPFVVFLFGSRNFIEVVSFTGAVFAGLEGLLILWIYKLAQKRGKRRPEYSLRLPFAIIIIIGLIFIGGVVYEVTSFF